MYKSDLKSGMVVECENGMLYLVILDHCVDDKSYLVGLDRKDLKFNNEHIPLSYYNDNLHNFYFYGFDIKNIYVPPHIYNITNLSQYKTIPISANETCSKIRDMTFVEIEKELGYKIRIVE